MIHFFGEPHLVGVYLAKKIAIDLVEATARVREARIGGRGEERIDVADVVHGALGGPPRPAAVGCGEFGEEAGEEAREHAIVARAGVGALRGSPAGREEDLRSMGVVPGALLGITENIVRVLELLEGGGGLGVVGGPARRLGDLVGVEP